MAATAPTLANLRYREQALARGNYSRSRRARFKAQLRAGEIRIEEMLIAPEWWLATVPVHELLGWTPSVGRDRVSRWLRRADVWPLKEVGQLTMAQRQRLVAEIQRGGR